MWSQEAEQEAGARKNWKEADPWRLNRKWAPESRKEADPWWLNRTWAPESWKADPWSWTGKGRQKAEQEKRGSRRLDRGSTVRSGWAGILMHLGFRNSDAMNRSQTFPFVLQLSDCTRNFKCGLTRLSVYLKQRTLFTTQRNKLLIQSTAVRTTNSKPPRLEPPPASAHTNRKMLCKVCLFIYLCLYIRRPSTLHHFIPLLHHASKAKYHFLLRV